MKGINGITQTVKYLLDRSSSMQGAKLQAAKDALKEHMADEFLSGYAAFSLGIFNQEYENYIPIEIMKSPTKYSNKIKSIQAEGGTALWDSIIEALEDLLQNGQGELALIALTDGEDNESKKSYQEVIDFIVDSEVDVKIIIIGLGDVDTFELNEIRDRIGAVIIEGDDNPTNIARGISEARSAIKNFPKMAGKTIDLNRVNVTTVHSYRKAKSDIEFSLEGDDAYTMKKALRALSLLEKGILNEHDIHCGTVEVPVREIDGDILNEWFKPGLNPDRDLCPIIMEHLHNRHLNERYEDGWERPDVEYPCQRAHRTFCVFISDLDYNAYAVSNDDEFRQQFPHPGIYIKERERGESPREYRTIKTYALTFEAIKAYLYYCRPRWNITETTLSEPILLSALALLAMEDKDIQNLIRFQGKIGGSWAILPYYYPRYNTEAVLLEIIENLDLELYMEGEFLDMHDIGEAVREGLRGA